MKIFWSPLAVERLKNIFNYISKEDVEAAYKLTGKIFKKIESIAKFPERGRIVPEASRKEIREIFESEHRIIYRVEAKRIVILSIRNFKQLLPGKDLK